MFMPSFVPGRSGLLKEIMSERLEVVKLTPPVVGARGHLVGRVTAIGIIGEPCIESEFRDRCRNAAEERVGASGRGSWRFRAKR